MTSDSTKAGAYVIKVTGSTISGSTTYVSAFITFTVVIGSACSLATISSTSILDQTLYINGP